MKTENLFCIYCKKVLVGNNYDSESQSHVFCKKEIETPIDHYDRYLIKEESLLLKQLETEIKAIYQYFKSLFGDEPIPDRLKNWFNFSGFVCDRDFRVENNKVTYLDIELFTSLDISKDYPIIKFPETILKFSNLKILLFRSAGHIIPPVSIGCLKNLEVLYLDSTSFEEIPRDLDQLKKLNRVYIDILDQRVVIDRFKGKIPLQSFKKEFSRDELAVITRIPNLKEIVIRFAIKNLIPDLGKMLSLENIEINLGNLTYFSFPDDFGNLKNLKKLEFYRIYYLPDSFGELENLEELSIVSSRLETLPDSFGNLKKLKSLSIYGNYEKLVLPKSFGNLSCLETLELIDIEGGISIHNSFSRLPIKTLVLEKFPESSYFHNKVPAIVAKLKYLETLDIDRRMKLPKRLSKKIKVVRQ